MIRRLLQTIVIVTLGAVLAAGCATGRAFSRGEAAGKCCFRPLGTPDRMGAGQRRMRLIRQPWR